jgi:Heterokaryon incompatibility protein (HET)
VCINQQKVKEVERQMAKMDLIYQGATNVCICVGTKGDNSDLVPTFVKKILNMENLDELTRSTDAVKRWSAFSTFMQRDCRYWRENPLPILNSLMIFS